MTKKRDQPKKIFSKENFEIFKNHIAKEAFYGNKKCEKYLNKINKILPKTK